MRCVSSPECSGFWEAWESCIGGRTWWIKVEISSPGFVWNMASKALICPWGGFHPTVDTGRHAFGGARQSNLPQYYRVTALGTKNRQIQTANLCKQHLREQNPTNLGLVNEFIVEIEGTGKNHDVSNWGQFADASWKNDAMLKRLDAEFEKWLNP